jgi:hypothetical protein
MDADAATLGPAAQEVAITDVLAYRAPFLIEKLVKNRIADSEEEAEALFAEVKKYLVITRSDDQVSWKMYSVRVDEAWHQFILYTDAYTEFCERFFGAYVGHSPGNLPAPLTPGSSGGVSTLDGFRNRYRELFAIDLPEIWDDARAVTASRRVFNDAAGVWECREAGDFIELVGGHGTVLMSVDVFARDALAFITRTGAFYVRELPGDLTEEEKVGLVSALVEYRLLRFAP